MDGADNVEQVPEQGAFWEPVEPSSRGALLPAKSVEWFTPSWIYRPLHAEFNFTVDVAASASNAQCERYYTKETNGLLQDWRGERPWCNPPYSSEMLEAFVGKAWRTTRRDPLALACFLVPVKSEQPWWHRYALRSEVRFIPGRVMYGNAEASAPFPSAIVVISQRHVPHMTAFRSSQLPLAGLLVDG